MLECFPSTVHNNPHTETSGRNVWLSSVSPLYRNISQPILLQCDMALMAITSCYRCHVVDCVPYIASRNRGVYKPFNPSTNSLTNKDIEASILNHKIMNPSWSFKFQYNMCTSAEAPLEVYKCPWFKTIIVNAHAWTMVIMGFHFLSTNYWLNVAMFPYYICTFSCNMHTLT